MHYTLLTESERVNIHREYRIRALMVFCYTMAIAVAIGMVVLFPAYIAAYLSENSENQLVSAQQVENKDLAKMKNELIADAGTLRSLSTYVNSPAISSLISEIVEAGSAVKIYSVNVDSISTSSAAISLQGIAPTRSVLLGFKAKLESLDKIAKVEFPISGLTKSVSVPFSLRITRSLP
jgi:hypothetical protein